MKHKYIFYIYPSENEKHGTFFFTAHSVDVKRRLRERNVKFDFKKLW